MEAKAESELAVYVAPVKVIGEGWADGSWLDEDKGLVGLIELAESPEDCGFAGILGLPGSFDDRAPAGLIGLSELDGMVGSFGAELGSAVPESDDFGSDGGVGVVVGLGALVAVGMGFVGVTAGAAETAVIGPAQAVGPASIETMA